MSDAPKFAADTSVPVERSRNEVERMLTRYGADLYFSGYEASRAYVAFRAHNRMVRFNLKLPARDEPRFTHIPKRNSWNDQKLRTPDQALKLWEQECRRVWRALALVVKAKLEAVASGISTFEDEFLAHIQMPDGSAFGAWAKVAIAGVYDSGLALPEVSTIPSEVES